MFLVYEVTADQRKIVVALNCGETNAALTDQSIFSARLVFGEAINRSIAPNSAAVWVYE
jgi:hypothetical protein